MEWGNGILTDLEKWWEKISDKLIDEMKHSLILILEVDLTSWIATEYVEWLFMKIEKDNLNTIMDIKDSMGVIFSEVWENVYGPFLVSFTDYVLSHYKKTWKIFFLARDAIPMYTIAKELLKKKTYNDLTDESIDLLYITRNMLWISDEIAVNSNSSIEKIVTTTKGALQEYFNQHGVDANSVIIDWWFYWSIVQQLYHEIYEENQENMPWFQFMVSKNPLIDGYINQYQTKENEQIMYDLIDCLETTWYFPMKSPRQLEQKEWVRWPVLEKYEYPYWLWTHIRDSLHSWYSLAIDNYLSWNTPSIGNQLKNLILLQEKAKKWEFTWVIPYWTPEWSRKEQFLDDFATDMGKVKSL